MKKIPPGGPPHPGSGFPPSSPGYSLSGVHQSANAPYPPFQPLGPSSMYKYRTPSKPPSYASFMKEMLKYKNSPPHSHPFKSQVPLELDYNPNLKPSLSQLFKKPPSGPPVELDYNPNLRPFGKHPGAGPVPLELDYDPTLKHQGHIGQLPLEPNYNTHTKPLPPSTNYGYPVKAIESQKHTNVQAQLAHSQQQQPVQHAQPLIHITPTTNFIEYTNIDATGQQQTHPQNDHPTSQQVAQQVIQYLGNLQQGAASADEPIPLFPAGTNPEEQPFVPTPLPPDDYPDFSGEPIPTNHHKLNNQFDSYGNPLQRPQSFNQLQILQHPNPPDGALRNKPNSDFDIVKSVSIELPTHP